jgi:hypothetical protein
MVAASAVRAGPDLGDPRAVAGLISSRPPPRVVLSRLATPYDPPHGAWHLGDRASRPVAFFGPQIESAAQKRAKPLEFARF